MYLYHDTWYSYYECEVKDQLLYLSVVLGRLLGLLFQSVDVLFKRRGDTAGLEENRVCSCKGVTSHQKFLLLTERFVEHQFLSAILLVLWTAGVRGAVRTYNDDYILPPLRWL